MPNRQNRQAVKIILTCEHASNSVPKAFLDVCSPKLLQSHRGWDKGALWYAYKLSNLLEAPLFCGRISRLLIDLNRSLHHRLLSSCPLPLHRKEQLLMQYWKPFRDAVQKTISEAVEEKRTVLHFSCHTFTPVFHGKVRRCDVGILYDPARPGEQEVAYHVASALRKETSLSVRKNYPYRGVSDGHTTSLRKQFSNGEYRGIEIEVNQAIVDSPYWKKVGVSALARALSMSGKYERDE